MQIEPFKLDRYFANYEFSVPYFFSSSDCDTLTLNEVLDLADAPTKELWLKLKLGYTEDRGLPLLREEIAKMYRGVHADQVLLVTPREGIFLAMNCLLAQGDHVICTFPCFQSLQLGAALGCEVTQWQAVEEDGWRFDPEFLERNIRPRTKLIVFNFPHNPTGYLPSSEDFHRIIAVAKSHGIPVFSDEMFRLLEFDAAQRLPSAIEAYDKAIVLSAMSKTFGMAGTRIGWLVVKDKQVYEKLSQLKDYTTNCSSAPSEILALMALRAKDTILTRHCNLIRTNLSLLDSFFARHTDRLRWIRPKGGTMGFPRLLGDYSVTEFARRLVEQAGVLIAPSTVFNYGDQHFRLGFGRRNMPEALELFERFCQNNLGSAKNH